MSLSELIRHGARPSVAKVAGAKVKTNDAALAALLREYGDGSAQGVCWSAWCLTATACSPTWAVVTERGLTLLLAVGPIPRPRSYAKAWSVARVNV